MMTADDIKDRVVRRIATFRVAAAGDFAYRGRPGDPPSLAASCDAAMSLHCVDRLDPGPRAAWAAYVNGFQDPETGWFRDPNSAWVNASRLDPWLFGFALRALNALGAEPAHPLRFLDAWSTPERLCEWIFAGRDIMHLAIICFRRGRGRHPFPDFEKTFFAALMEHRARFVPDRPAFRRALANHVPHAAQAILKDAFHELFAWYAADRRIPQVPLYVDWFLEEQDADGLLFQNADAIAPYSHMDGLQLLVEFALRTGHRRDDCVRAVERGLAALLDDRHADGFWRTDWLHLLLASCETIAEAVRLLPDHPLAAAGWHCVWDLAMWRLPHRCFAR